MSSPLRDSPVWGQLVLNNTSTPSTLWSDWFDFAMVSHWSLNLFYRLLYVCNYFSATKFERKQVKIEA